MDKITLLIGIWILLSVGIFCLMPPFKDYDTTRKKYLTVITSVSCIISSGITFVIGGLIL